MMDGVSAMDTGSNRPLLQMNVESIAEVKVLTSGYQAEYGPRERRADHGRHEERHQPLPRVGLRRGAQFGLVLEQQDQQAQWRPQGDPEGEGLGLFDRRPDRQAGREQQAVLLLRPGILAAHGREQRRALPDAHRARTRGGLLAVDRQQRQPVPVHQGSAADGRVLGSGSDGLLPGRRRARQDPRGPPLPNRVEHPEALSAAEPARWRPRARTATTSSSPGRRRACSRTSRRFASTISRCRSCARPSSIRRGCSGTSCSWDPSPASTTRECRARPSSATRRR